MAGRISMTGTKESSSRAMVPVDAGKGLDSPASTATGFTKPSRRGTKGSKLSSTSKLSLGSSAKSGLSIETSAKNEDSSSSGQSTSSSDKFMVGIVGAALMILQVVILVSGLTSWLRVRNTEKVEELRKILGENYTE
mmetsp:Transcript_59133/g.105121  ORF Transcript_59133/g.105121 Transcript_59133/m.105121 type:complete len:137 (-) Transcript_59133:250-660(-)|eukprot:CAMPEP_0197665364 /NCGR_PEP_ID=MMETSP1338-20131121/59182_1 /TAXON_ID=43686 ORGANISM="Pelagodinium beii, Strain RCC1491" /NCGR_SAMPLE_ID=MMETSP1338 /ASSEMBLY_ACC=CAM_ASM_000754 /LENGTH=136 /DNA_ID=CAMNT_0043244151 /DNA_START=92 /DNA_END=502 /DNA_ORIENTATION=-